MAEIKLIKIKFKKDQKFMSVLKSIREKSTESISFYEITEEVEKARKLRLKIQ